MGKKVNGKIKMKMQTWLRVVIAVILLGIPSVDAPAAVNVYSTVGRASFAINSEPSFVYLRTQGFSISVGSPYDIVYYGNRYYLNHNGRWYRSYSYRGPWILIGNNGLPSRIRRHRMEDIRRYRDIEYRKSDSRNNRYQRNDDIRRSVNEKKYKPSGSRKALEQPNRATEGRNDQQAPGRMPGRNVLEQPIRAPGGMKAQERPKNGPPERTKPHEQQKKGDKSGGNKDRESKRQK
jgi:hypothetical protein